MLHSSFKISFLNLNAPLYLVAEMTVENGRRMGGPSQFLCILVVNSLQAQPHLTQLLIFLFTSLLLSNTSLEK
jgi:hypothetical protein